MSKLKVLGEAISLTSAVAQTAVAMNATPFAPNFNGIVTVHLAGATGTPTVKVQGSSDGGTTWVDLVTVTAITGLVKKDEVTIYALMRLNVSAVGTAGTCSAYLEA
ncbi:hypothetical protein RHOFW510R12_01490 [Rhodanobacter sp. FW510-R12]|uniref:hypothetical protein n=1 Tax=unclassified Rhodanobacter TaxID=2621553 RepID=UPI0007AA44DC|nr:MULTISPECIES: hypothetical protein [unclassified Rhodanobacter]KZC17021.1 hypothetical protein RHOFW104R8_13350 [Rhodanobacter sp. FW104-R8]KZC28545.1 hypothetical protein RhoFW510T8_10590 [Rhodanobacter sp. FW510-T8]KZC32352.1 hypothetical protein RhoFW510R10_13035 [Rhodanobacter sp. FW510-R10]